MVDNEGGSLRAANLVVALAYFYIPVQLLRAVEKAGGRSALPAHAWRLVALFAAFILLCGTTHLLRLLGGGPPALETSLIWATAVVSVTTAVVFQGVSVAAFRMPIENSRLERTVAELCAKRDEADEATRTLTNFIGFLCHEIRNPLHAVTGLADMLRDRLVEKAPKAVGEEEGEIFSGIRTACDMMKAVLNDSLDLSKMRAGQMELEVLPFDCRAALANVTHCFTGRAESGSVRLELDLDALPPGNAQVLGDPVRLCQLATNLISNALKFTRAGGLVTVSAAGVSAPPGAPVQLASCLWLRLEVADTGVGIPESAQPNLFKAFTQAHPSTAREYGGTGLGLAICASICEAAGGSISMTSKVGVGTSFVVLLPLERQRTGGSDSRSRPAGAVPRPSLAKASESRSALLPGSKLPSELGAGESGEGGDLELGSVPFEAAAAPECEAKVTAPASVRRERSQISIRVAEAGACVEVPGLSPVPAAGAPSPDPFGRPFVRALVVDDNALVRRVNKYQLGRAGCEVVAVGSGAEALQLLAPGGANQPFHLVAVDLHMPGMDGFGVAREARRLGYTGTMLACTGGTGSAGGDMDDARTAGFDGLLYKPLPQDKLCKAVDEICERVGARKKLAAHAASPSASD